MLYFLNCVNKWCRQTCPYCDKQYTKCDSVSSDGKTCYNPRIRDGSKNDIIMRPVKETKYTDTEQSEGLLQWCKQLFPYAKKGMAVYSFDTSSISGKEGVYWSYGCHILCIFIFCKKQKKILLFLRKNKKKQKIFLYLYFNSYTLISNAIFSSKWSLIQKCSGIKFFG